MSPALAAALAVIIVGSVALGWLLNDAWQEWQAQKAERIIGEPVPQYVTDMLHTLNRAARPMVRLDEDSKEVTLTWHIPTQRGPR